MPWRRGIRSAADGSDWSALHTHTHTHEYDHTHAHRGLKIEGWPERAPSLNIDPYLMMPLRRNEEGGAEYLRAGQMREAGFHFGKERALC